MGLFRLIVFGVLLWLAYGLLRRLIFPPAAGPQPKSVPGATLVKDPHCGLYVDNREAISRKVGNGTLFFCSQACAEAYGQGPNPGTRSAQGQEKSG
ncbi:MAG: hypothetical protein OEV94_00445 [Deltaproteobacteria bacterium]|nr:hypothetical protein [Deltaproteobacteria bacterium]